MARSGAICFNAVAMVFCLFYFKALKESHGFRLTGPTIYTRSQAHSVLIEAGQLAKPRLRAVPADSDTLTKLGSSTKTSQGESRKSRKKKAWNERQRRISEEKQLQQKIKSLGQEGKWKEAVALAERAPAPNAHHLRAAVAAAARNGRPQEALRLLGLMEARGLAQGPGAAATYNIVLKALLAARDWSEALLLFYQFKGTLTPGTPEAREAYGYALRCLEASGGGRSSQQLFQELKAKDPEGATGLNAAVHFRTLAKAKLWEEAHAAAPAAFVDPRFVNLALCNFAAVAAAKSGDADAAVAFTRRPDADAITFSAAIDGCARCGRCAEAARLLAECEARGGPPPPPRLLNSLLHCYQASGQWEEALAAFDRAKAQGPTRPDHITYCTLMLVLATHGDAARVAPLAAELGALAGSGGEAAALLERPTTRALDRVMCELGRRGEGRAAQALLAAVEGPLNVTATPLTYAAAIAANDARSPRAVAALYRRMQEAGHAPDEVTLGSALKAYQRGAGSGPELVALVHELWRQGRPVDVPTYTRIFAVLAKKGQPKLIRELIREMQYRNQPVNEAIYTAQVVSYYKAGRLADALEELRRLRRAGLPVRAAAYTAVITACRKERAVDLALELYRELKEDPLRVPTQITYNALISVMTYAGDMKKAEDIVEEMQERGYLPDSITMQSLAFGYSRLSLWHQVVDTVDRFEAARCIGGKWPMFNEAIRASEKLKDWKSAVRIFDVMRSRGLRPDRQLYRIVLALCSRAGEWETCFQILDKMTNEDKFDADLTAHILTIEACEKKGEWKPALNLLLTMIKNGTQPDTAAYNAALSACTSAGQWPMALKILESLQTANIPCNKKTYSTAILAYRKMNQWQKCLNSLVLMEVNGLEPDESDISAVIDIMEKSGQYSKGVYIFEEFIASKKTPRPDPLSSRAVELGSFDMVVVKACIRSGLQSLLEKHGSSGSSELPQLENFIITASSKSQKAIEQRQSIIMAENVEECAAFGGATSKPCSKDTFCYQQEIITLDETYPTLSIQLEGNEDKMIVTVSNKELKKWFNAMLASINGIPSLAASYWMKKTAPPCPVDDSSSFQDPDYKPKPLFG